nr:MULTISPECIES: transposase [unclassified Mycolicibacterium]
MYLNQPARAVVFSFDEKTQCQALDPRPTVAADEIRPRRNNDPRLQASRHHRLVRGYERRHRRSAHRSPQGRTGADVLGFFKQIDASVPRGLAVHVVLDNLSAHTTPDITKWLAHKDRRRWHMHPTPTSSSWLNLIERWFKEPTDKRLRRGVFTSVADLTDAITTWAEHLEHHPKPFIWKATAEDIIAKVRRGRATLNHINSH